ncbi:unnamed protein product [Mortierella alpina]
MRGAGKREELANARSEGEVLTNLARQVRYIPLFQFMTTINNMMNMAITATTGQKAGLSATFEGQLKKILDTLTIAIQEASPTKDMSFSPEAIMMKIEATVEEKTRCAEMVQSGCSGSTMSLESRRAAKAKKRKDKEESHWCDPDEIPVIVIDGFMSKEEGPHAKELWTHLSEWAAVLVENHVAHHLDRDEFPDLIESVQTIGGRLTDLELFVQKVKSGMGPEDAVHDILGRAVIEVRKSAFDFDSTDGRTLTWTPIQFCAVMKQLANSELANFDELKIHPLFKNDESPSAAMEQAELITIVHKNGRPAAVRPGKPIYPGCVPRHSPGHWVLGCDGARVCDLLGEGGDGQGGQVGVRVEGAVELAAQGWEEEFQRRLIPASSGS